MPIPPAPSPVMFHFSLLAAGSPLLFCLLFCVALVELHALFNRMPPLLPCRLPSSADAFYRTVANLLSV